jgi:ribosome-associated heat shock protein Hsp15
MNDDSGASADPATSPPAAPSAQPAVELPPALPSTRVDRWLWAVRLTKTRGEAAQACRGGHVEVNDRSAKPSTPVRAGDKVKAHLHGRLRIVEVGHVIDRRLGGAAAARCYTDHTPPAPAASKDGGLWRDRGAGRPTKRDRRQLDRLRRGGSNRGSPRKHH